MRHLLVGILVLTATVTTQAIDLFSIAQPAPIQFGPLDIDENTIRVVASRNLGGGRYDIVIEFKILPNNTREENYAGLRQVPGLPKFQAMHSHQGQPFRVPGTPRMVTHRMTVNAVKGAMPLEINGAKFGIIEANGQVELQKISPGKR